MSTTAKSTECVHGVACDELLKCSDTDCILISTDPDEALCNCIATVLYSDSTCIQQYGQFEVKVCRCDPFPSICEKKKSNCDLSEYCKRGCSNDGLQQILVCGSKLESDQEGSNTTKTACNTSIVCRRPLTADILTTSPDYKTGNTVRQTPGSGITRKINTTRNNTRIPSTTTSGLVQKITTISSETSPNPGLGTTRLDKIRSSSVPETKRTSAITTGSNTVGEGFPTTSLYWGSGEIDSPQIQSGSKDTVIALGSVAGVAISALIVVLLLWYFVYRKHHKRVLADEKTYIDINTSDVSSTSYATLSPTDRSGHINRTPFAHTSQAVTLESSHVSRGIERHDIAKALQNTWKEPSDRNLDNKGMDENTYNCIDEERAMQESWYSEPNDPMPSSSSSGQQCSSTSPNEGLRMGNNFVLEQLSGSSDCDFKKHRHVIKDPQEATFSENYFVLESTKDDRLANVTTKSNRDTNDTASEYFVLEDQGSNNTCGNKMQDSSTESPQNDYFILEISQEGTDTPENRETLQIHKAPVCQTPVYEEQDYDWLKHPMRHSYDYISDNCTQQNTDDFQNSVMIAGLHFTINQCLT